MRKRVFFVIFNGLSLGALPGSPEENNVDLFTLKRIYRTGKLNIPLLRNFGLFNIDGVDFGRKSCIVYSSFGRCACDPQAREGSFIKDLIGISGITSDRFVLPSGFSFTAAGGVCRDFEDCGFAELHRTSSNKEALDVMIRAAKTNFNGICAISVFDDLSNTVTDEHYPSYVSSVNYVDRRISQFLQLLRTGDILVITSDAAELGCMTPVMIYGEGIRGAVNLGTRASYKDIGATVSEYFGFTSDGNSFLPEIEKSNAKGKENENQ